MKNKLKLIGAIAALSIATSAFSLTGQRFNDYGYVVDVEAVYKKYSNQRIKTKTCWDEKHHDDSITDEIFGSIIGGAIGNKIGGSNKDAATVLGAVIGASVANENKHKHYSKRCSTSYSNDSDFSHYNVTYEYNNKIFTVRMDNRPNGNRIKLRVNLRPIK